MISPNLRRLLLLFLSHDVDWPPGGPGSEHVIARRDRFSEDIIERVNKDGFNPYNGIRHMMEIEDKLGVRSTFFFRPSYDDNTTVDAYSDEIRELKDRGWEIGAHLNDASTKESVLNEKKKLENVLGSKITGSRVHYLRTTEDKLHFLSESEFLYDSSIVYTRDKADERNTSYKKFGKLVVFPITFMDAYLFSYAGLNEANVVEYVTSNLRYFKIRNVELVTLLWHDNVLHMKGGRKYEDLLERTLSIGDIRVVRGIDAYNMIKNSVGR